MANEHVRNQRDADFEVVKALPAAAANHNTDSLDIGQAVGGIPENIAFEIEIPALPALENDKSLTVKVHDSADNSSFAAIDPLIQTTVTGAGGTGSAAKTVRFRLPPTARRYIALNLAVESAGGDNTAKSVTFRALF